MRTLFSLDLDICSEYSVNELMVDCSNYGVVAELVDANGPGGGNPIYKFSSFDRDSLVAFAVLCGYDEKNYGDSTYVVEDFITEETV